MTDSNTLIDVKELLAKYDLDQHIARADAYFARFDAANSVCRKPFASIAEASNLISGLGSVLHGLELFEGARVVDFGCGLGWLSFALADLGCEVIGVDASQNALALARELGARRFPPPPSPPRFLAFDGRRFDLPDGSVDRIVTFDALHHLPEHAAILAEMHRLLKDDGIAAFHEPGPGHSLSPQSQAEMRDYEVIENDIVIEDLERQAQGAGFARMMVAYQGRIPFMVPVDRFNALLAGRDPALATEVINATNGENRNLRIFFLHKASATRKDSRRPDGLAHHLTATGFRLGTGGRALECDVVACNTGTATWLASAHRTGAVNLGVHLLEQDGRMILRDYHRVHLFKAEVPPGAEITATASIPLPGDRERGSYAFGLDLVSENVAWFGDLGSTALRVIPRFEADPE